MREHDVQGREGGVRCSRCHSSLLYMRAFILFMDKRTVALRGSNTLHCMAEGNTRLEKTALSQYFSLHAVTERMAAPGCEERESGGVKLWFTHIFMSWLL